MQIDFTVPRVDGMPAEQAIATLYRYLDKIGRDLSHVLTNLDAGNFNEEGLAEILKPLWDAIHALEED